MDDKNNQTSSHDTVQVYHIIIWIVIGLVIVGGISYYIFHTKKIKNPSAVVTTQKIPTNFSPNPFLGFPQEIIPKYDGIPQYFDDIQSIGAIFLVKKPITQVETDYEAQIKKLSHWSVSLKNLSPLVDSLLILNKNTTAQAQITIMSLSEGTTTVTISLKK